MQNAALRTDTGCTQDTNIQHLHDETLTLPIHEHLQLHASHYKQKTQHLSHLLHKLTKYFNTPRYKNPLFLTTAATQQYAHRPHTITTTDIQPNMRHVHTSEEILPRLTRRTLAQFSKITLPQIIFIQSRRQITFITTIPPL